MEVHVFEGTGIIGEVIESDEMRPAWFESSAIPLDDMWADDPYWLPQLLAGEFDGKRFSASFTFRAHEGPGSKDILEHSVKLVNES